MSAIMATAEGRKYLEWVEGHFDAEKDKRLISAITAQLDGFLQDNKEN